MASSSFFPSSFSIQPLLGAKRKDTTKNQPEDPLKQQQQQQQHGRSCPHAGRWLILAVLVCHGWAMSFWVTMNTTTITTSSRDDPQQRQQHKQQQQEEEEERSFLPNTTLVRKNSSSITNTNRTVVASTGEDYPNRLGPRGHNQPTNSTFLTTTTTGHSSYPKHRRPKQQQQQQQQRRQQEPPPQQQQQAPSSIEHKTITTTTTTRAPQTNSSNPSTTTNTTPTGEKDPEGQEPEQPQDGSSKQNNNITATTAKTPTTSSSLNITLWCLLDNGSTETFFHFPHALQSLSLCWSFFMDKQAELQQARTEISEIHSNSSMTTPSPTTPVTTTWIPCHINMHEKLKPLKSVDKDWRAALVFQVMGCTVSYHSYNISQLTHNGGSLPVMNGTLHLPDKHNHTPQDNKMNSIQRDLPRSNATHQHYLYRPKREDVYGLRFFWHPRHARQLYQRLQDTLATTKKDRNPKEEARTTTTNTTSTTTTISAPRTPPLSIGLVNRRKSRRIGNMDQIAEALGQLYPHAQIQQTDMDDMATPLDQFAWWSQHSLVILPHGASSTNLVFLPAGAAVIEVFPPHYYWWGFLKLAHSMQVRYYGYFPILIESNTTLNSTYTTTPPDAANRTFTDQQLQRRRQQQQHERAGNMVLDDFRLSCPVFKDRQKYRAIPVMKPSIPHLMVLVQRALDEGQLVPQNQQQVGRNNNNQSLYYTPQISHIEPACHSVRNNVERARSTMVHSLNLDDPPESLIQRSGGS